MTTALLIVGLTAFWFTLGYLKNTKAGWYAEIYYLLYTAVVALSAVALTTYLWQSIDGLFETLAINLLVLIGLWHVWRYVYVERERRHTTARMRRIFARARSDDPNFMRGWEIDERGFITRVARDDTTDGEANERDQRDG
jgi:ABC-type nickel/cobalt efflux system permease component RcnA